MKQFFSTSAILFAVMICSSAQITVSDDNNVGIGISAPESKLSIGHTGYSKITLMADNTSTDDHARTASFLKSYSGGSYSYGVFGHHDITSGVRLHGGSFSAYHSTTVQSTRRTFGIRAVAGNGANGYNWGVFGYLYGSSNGAAVYGCTNGSEAAINGKYAGFFRGNVEITGTLTVAGQYVTSDIELKKDISLLKNENVSQLDKLNTLCAIKYKLKTPAEVKVVRPLEVDKVKSQFSVSDYDDELYTKDHIGLSAQDVRNVYPELVKEDNDGFLSLNYTGLIPVLIEAIKEQEEVITAHENAIRQLQAELEALQEDVAVLVEESESTGETK